MSGAGRYWPNTALGANYIVSLRKNTYIFLRPHRTHLNSFSGNCVFSDTPTRIVFSPLDKIYNLQNSIQMTTIKYIFNLITCLMLVSCLTPTQKTDTLIGIHHQIFVDGKPLVDAYFASPVFPSGLLHRNFGIPFNDSQGYAALRLSMDSVLMPKYTDDIAIATLYKEHCTAFTKSIFDNVTCIQRKDIPIEQSKAQMVVLKPGNSYRIETSQGNYIVISFYQMKNPGDSR